MTAGIGNYQEEKPTAYVQGLFELSTVQKHRLGTVRELDDGRRFVYCSNTAAQIGAGILISKAAAPADATVAAADVTFGGTVGSKKVSVTISATPTLNLYRDGFLIITAGAGVGEMYKIKGNTADDDPATGRFTLYLYDALRTLWVAANTTISLWENSYKNLLLNPAVSGATATTEETAMGLTTQIIPASNYFWAQTWGLATGYVTASTSGDEPDERPLVAGTTAGYFLSVTARGAERVLGHLLEGADVTDGETNLIFLTIS